VLLTALTAAANAAGTTPSTQVVIGSSQPAAGVAGAYAPAAISPTIKVAQGTPLRIFVARDLDFAPVEEAP
jgi:type IV secretion system protein VirB10